MSRLASHEMQRALQHGARVPERPPAPAVGDGNVEKLRRRRRRWRLPRHVPPLQPRGREAGSRNGDRIRGASDGSGERANETWMSGAAEGGFESHCGGGVMAVRLGWGAAGGRCHVVHAASAHGVHMAARAPRGLVRFSPRRLPSRWPLSPRCPLSRWLGSGRLPCPRLAGPRLLSLLLALGWVRIFFPPGFLLVSREGSSNFFPLLWWLCQAKCLPPL